MAPERQTPPGSASASSRAGNVNAVAVEVQPSTITSPTVPGTLMRNRICSSGGRSAFLPGDCLLHGDRAFDGIDRTGEIRDDAVAGSIENTAVMDGDQLVEDHPIRLQLPQRADFIGAHQTAVLGDIGGKDGGELPLY